jgi:cAMP-dependent protein kinase regulator
VSAEVFGKYNVKAAFKPKVVKKSQQAKDSIKNRL